MKDAFLYCFILLFFVMSGCKEDGSNDLLLPDEPVNKVTSEEFIDDLLFVNKNNFKINTNNPAQFFSNNPLIQISSDGTVSRLTSGEVVPIEITWTDQPGVKTTIYALGATDTNHDEPYASFHGALATDPYNSYILGWKTFRKLPVGDQTFAIILRHADADDGKDFTVNTGPANWWKSCDRNQARQLNDRGKRRAVELGKVFKDLNLPVTRVVSSEFCRSVSTAELMNLGPMIKQDGRVNHPEYNISGKSLFKGMLDIMNEQPVDNKMTMIVTHHPINETGSQGYPSFPAVSPFTWTGGYLISVSADKIITYQGAVSYSMMEYYRNLKLKRL